MCALLVYSLTSSGSTRISGALFARVRAHVHVRTLAREDSGLVSTTTGINPSALTTPPSPPRPPPPPLSKPTHTFMPLIPLFLIVPYAPRKESIETQSVFLMSAPARRSLAAAASFISSAAPLAEAFYCVLRGNTVTRETRDSSQPTISSLSLSLCFGTG